MYARKILAAENDNTDSTPQTAKKVTARYSRTGHAANGFIAFSYFEFKADFK